MGRRHSGWIHMELCHSLWHHGRERERVKAGAYGESCQKHSDALACLQLPGPRSFNKLPAGILKLWDTIGVTCRCTKTHSWKSILTQLSTNRYRPLCKCRDVNLRIVTSFFSCSHIHIHIHMPTHAHTDRCIECFADNRRRSAKFMHLAWDPLSL